MDQIQILIESRTRVG